MTESPTADHEDWPLRPWLLAGLLGAAGLLIHLVVGDDGPDTPTAWRAAVMALLFFGSLALAFTLDRDRWRAPAIFAAGAGLVMAGLAWRAVAGGDAYAVPQYGFMAGVIATALALPLFQSGFHRTRWATPYPLVHGHAWGDAIGAAGALAFTGASWLLLAVLSELFQLLKINVLQDLMREGWFGWTWSGAAFGAALGTLRNEGRILGTLQRVVMVVLSILGVPLALGLALFLVAMVVSGPDVLWEATRSATPVLLVCAAGAWVLANAIVRDTDADMSGNRVMRIAALVLTLSVLPLTVFAAISLGTRIAQYGLTPERIWGMIAIGVACAYGLAWVIAVVRGWRGRDAGWGWPARMRQANLHLAAAICVVALLLALPLLDFGAVSARSQIARLDAGKVSAADFDYQALRWDFGNAGRRALARLAKDTRPEVAKLAAAALRDRRTNRYEAPKVERGMIEVRTDNPAMRARVMKNLATDGFRCARGCYVIDLGPAEGGQRFAVVGGPAANTMILDAEGQFRPDFSREREASEVLYHAGDTVEIREVPRRMMVVNGKPVGDPID